MPCIIVLADVHCHLENLKKLLNSLPSDTVQIYSLGDIVGYRYEIDETIEIFKQHKIISIKGNHDKYVLDELVPTIRKRSLQESIEKTKEKLSQSARNYLLNLPDSFSLKVDDITLTFSHGSFEDTETYLYEEELEDYFKKHFSEGNRVGEINFFGHTHIPFLKNVCGRIFANPGSIGFPRQGYNPTYMLLEIGKINKAFQAISLENILKTV